MPSDCFSDFVIVNDEVTWFGVGLDVAGFACSWWADDKGDVGVGGAPGFFAGSVDSLVVAGVAGGSEVVLVPPWSALGDGDDVVDDGGCAGAFGTLDLAGVVVSLEDLFADAWPGAAVGGVCLVAHVSRVRGR